ncbi:ABC transporter ATP-binding protein [Microvirga makkahensis]|uniref:ATP-binding cassette domain-containing protein n=1 Tax=Microvirga makkahensis TaxID=1128670 RepID=A0A7X3SPE8_9HYPH|nr:ABC transporter ATP-binding protein [Microvirga makkahensis]MXQ12064.1 ATP-binding cassette domain-containing protein [Microvirga makkahensis]
MSAADALRVENVSHWFGVRQVLSEVSFRVPQGQFVALLGPNGAGKTTLFAIIARLYHSRTGAVRVFERDMQREPSRALADLGIVFQARTLDPDLTIGQNLVYHAALHGIVKRHAVERSAALLARVGLADRMDDKVRTLSGGQARRVEIARALIHQPRLLLLDEPTVGLDMASRSDIVADIRALVREEGLSVLWATHILDEIEPDDGVVVLHEGQVIASGPVRSVASEGGLATAFHQLTNDRRVKENA